MTSIDRLGFSLRVKTNEGLKGTRINFLREVSTSQAAREALIEMVGGLDRRITDTAEWCATILSRDDFPRRFLDLVGSEA